ncbi:MAG: homocitrate synthase [Thermodesulfobacteriota bacterium]
MQNKPPGDNVYPLSETPFQQMAHHEMSQWFERFVPAGFPVEMAVHSVSVPREVSPGVYVTPHAHADQDEINIILSKSALSYSIVMDGREQKVDAPAAVWIPAGCSHSANAISGEGFFICVKIKTGSGNPLHRGDRGAS